MADQTISQVEALAEAIETLRAGQDGLQKSARRTNEVLSQQGDIAARIAGAADASMLDNLDRSLGNVDRSLRSASEAADRAEDEFSGLEGQLRSLTTEQERNQAAMKTLTSSMGRLMAGGRLLLNFFGAAVSGLFQLGKAILLLPFNLLSGLVSFAADGGGGLELMQAYEEVRKTFGDLASGPARDLITSFQGVRAESGSLAGSGMSLRRVFGVGPGGLAAAMNFIREQAEGLGAQFQLLRGEFVQSAADLIILQKGMGLSTEQFGAFASVAIANGDSVVDTLSGVANLAIQLGDSFNISAKEISRDMATLSQDFVTFGNLSQEELATTAVFARQAGVSIEALTKITEKFKTFEDAAQSAAMLNQALGIQVDALAMLTANPAEQLSMLQEAFQATGRSVQDLNRAERELLATQTGLSGAELAAALAPENAGKSLEEIQAIAAGAAEAPLSTEEAMTRLADSIERVFESGGGMKSFFEAFAEGFEQGIRWFGPTRELFRNIRRSLRVTRQEGREFARMFVESFPGLIEMVEGLTELFKPEKFRQFFGKVTAEFRTFFTAMDPDNPSGSVGSFFERIQSAFTETFGGEAGSGILAKMKEGLSKMGSFLFNVLLGALPHITSAIVYLLDQLASILRSDGQSEIGAAFGDVMDSLGNVFAASWERLSPVLMETFQQLMESLGPALRAGLDALYENVIKPYGLWVVGAMLLLFAPQLAAGVLLQVVGAAISAVVTVVGGALGGIASLLGLGGGGMLDGIKASLKKIGEIIDEIGKINVANIGKAIVSMVKMAAFFTVGLGAFVAGVGAVYAIANAFGLFDDPTKLSLMLQVTAIAVLGSIGLILAGNALAGAAAGIGPAIAGMAAGALLMVVALPLFIGGLIGVMAIWDAAGLDAGKILATMAALGTAILATAGIIAGAAAFGALLLTPGANLLFGAAFAAGVAGLATALVTTATVLAPAIKSVIFAMSDVDPERGEAALELFSGTLQALQPITDIAMAAMAIEDADPAGIAQVLDSVKEMAVKMLESMSDFILSLVELLSGPGLSEEQVRMATGISAVLGSVTGLLGAFSGPMREFRDEVQRSGLGLGRGDRTTTEVAYASIRERVRGVSDLITSLATDGALQQLGQAIAEMGKIDITEEGLNKVTAVTGLLGSIGDTISTFASRGAEGTEIMRTGQIGQVFIAYRRAIGEMTRTVQSHLAPNMAALQESLSGFEQDQVATTIDTFGTIVQAYNDFYDAIRDLDSAVDINAAIERFGESLGIRNQELTINDGALSVTVNLNVTMDADQIATVLTRSRRGNDRLVTAGNVAVQ